MKYNFEDLMKENMNIQETPSEELKERVLNENRRDMEMKDKRKVWQYVPKIAAAALAAVVVTGGITYAATNLWDRFVAEDFGVAEDDALMKDLNEKGFAEQPQAAEGKDDLVSATDKDITVTVKQTLADEQSAYVCFEVKYGDQYHVVDEDAAKDDVQNIMVSPEKVNFQMDSGRDLNSSGSVNKIIDDHTVRYDYFLTTVKEEDSFKEGRIQMTISSFVMDEEEREYNPQVIADGKWDLVWDLSVGTEKRVYHLDKTLTLGEDQIVLKDLEISPLSCRLTMQSPDDVLLGDIGAVVKDMGNTEMSDLLDENGDMKVIRYIRTGGGENINKIMEELPEGQMLIALDTVALCLGDHDFEGMGGISYSGGEEDYLYSQFNKVLNLEEVTGVRAAGKYIDLRDISYETVK